jgi:hypothetical protein
MSLRIRRGTDAQRATTPLDLGELVFTTDTKQLYVGNGIDSGGDPIIRLGSGLAWADAQCTTIIATGVALQVSADTNPSLGGNLNLNSHNITGTGNISITGNITIPTNANIDVTTIRPNAAGSPLSVYSNISPAVQGIGVTNGTNVPSRIETWASKGTVDAPTNTVAGDVLTAWVTRGYNNGNYIISSIISSSWSSSATFGTSFPGSVVTIAAGNNAGNISSATFDGITKTFYAPVIKTGSYATASYPTSPTEGMIIFDSSLKSFYGYTGTLLGWKKLDN